MPRSNVQRLSAGELLLFASAALALVLQVCGCDSSTVSDSPTTPSVDADRSADPPLLEWTRRLAEAPLRDEVLRALDRRLQECRDDGEVVRALTILAASSDQRLRRRAAFHLSSCIDLSAEFGVDTVPAVTRLAEDENPRTRSIALVGLGAYDHAAMRRIVGAHLNDWQPDPEGEDSMPPGEVARRVAKSFDGRIRDGAMASVEWPECRYAAGRICVIGDMEPGKSVTLDVGFRGAILRLAVTLESVSTATYGSIDAELDVAWCAWTLTTDDGTPVGALVHAPTAALCCSPYTNPEFRLRMWARPIGRGRARLWYALDPAI